MPHGADGHDAGVAHGDVEDLSLVVILLGLGLDDVIVVVVALAPERIDVLVRATLVLED